MRIKKISLTNFRSHREFTIQDIPKYLIITGRNASGKSSILDGLTWALTGANQHTDSKGSGAGCLILDGEARALVEVVIQTPSGEHNIKRSIPHALSVDGSKGGVRRADELLSVILSPLTQAKLYQTLNSQRIIEEMSDNERRKFLSEVAGVGARTNDQILLDFSAWLPTVGISADSPRAIAARQLLQATAKKDYATFYGLRRDNNVQIDTLKTQVREVPRPEGVQVEDIDNVVRRIHAKITLNGLEEKLAIRAKESGNDGMAAIIPKPDVTKIQQKADNVRTICSSAQQAVTAREQRVALYDAQKAQVLSAAKQCPVFARQCPLSKEEIAEAVAATDVLKERDARELKNERRKLTDAEKALEVVQQELDRARKDIEQYKDIWSGDKVQFEKVRQIEEIQAETKQLEVRLKEMEEFRLNARLYAVNEETKARLTAAEEKAGVLELLVSAFAPAGMPTMLLTDHLPRLEALATEASRTITRNRYEITFSAVDGELDISVVSAGRKRPVHTLSTSERIWVALVLQHVVNQLIGNRILVIDEAATLDNDILTGLQQFLLNPELPYDNVFVCATTDEDVPFFPEMVTETMRVRLT